MAYRNTDFLTPLVVLDLADERASFCAKLLADLGAGVIRIAGPRGTGCSEKDVPSDTYHNGNKECLLLDLDDRKDRQAFRRLATKADVLIETFQGRYLSDRHLSFGYLAGINPRLIHLSVSGFGRLASAPYRRRDDTLDRRWDDTPDRRWDDTLIAASSGQMYVSGPCDGPPLKPPGNQSWYATSLFGAVAVLLALRERSRTGLGQFIDLSARESAISTLDHVMVDYFSEGAITRRQGSVYGDMGFAILPCMDGYIQISIEQNWETLIELMASEEMAGDLTEDCWRDKDYRRSRFGRALETVARWTGNHGKDELFEMGQAMRFPWAPVCSPEETCASPQLEARSLFSRSTGGKTPDRPYPGAPYLFDGSRPAPGNPVISATRVAGQAQTDERGEGPVSDEPFSPAASGPIPGSKGVLEGIRVLDLTWMLAGPFATRILADAGAEVIKIQSARTAKGGEENTTAYFATWNRNKRSVALNLEHPEARQLTLALAATSDIVVESFSPRVMAEWGLTYDRIKEAKADIVMASISAMGQTGPWKDYVGYGPTFHALSGLTHTMSRHLHKPVCLGHAYGDTIVGLYAALALLTALHYRDATGEGRYIDISGYEAVCSVLGPMFADGTSNAGSNAVLEGTYRCRGEDRWCVITVADERQWHSLRVLVGDPELYSPHFSTHRKRLANRARLDGIISRWTGNRTAEEVAHSLEQVGVPAAVVLDARDLAGDLELAARRNFITLKHPVLGATVSDRTPLFFGRSEPAGWRAAPLLGADNGYVLGRILGISDKEIKEYIRKGVIG